ncbi:MAG: hypothetical protein GY856_17570 [bacterium]|nr:hypothetical protein [bacterium]
MAKFDLTLELEHWSGGIGGSLVYSTDLFDGTTAVRLAGRAGLGESRRGLEPKFRNRLVLSSIHGNPYHESTAQELKQPAHPSAAITRAVVSAAVPQRFLGENPALPGRRKTRMPLPG